MLLPWSSEETGDLEENNKGKSQVFFWKSNRIQCAFRDVCGNIIVWESNSMRTTSITGANKCWMPVLALSSWLRTHRKDIYCIIRAFVLYFSYVKNRHVRPGVKRELQNERRKTFQCLAPLILLQLLSLQAAKRRFLSQNTHVGLAKVNLDQEDRRAKGYSHNQRRRSYPHLPGSKLHST